MSQFFPKPFRSFWRNINVKVDLSNYARKSDLRKCNRRWYFKFCTKKKLSKFINWSWLDTDKLKSAPVDLSKLSNVVKNEVVKKTVYDKLGAIVNNIDTSGFVLKAKYNADKTELEKQIPDVSNLIKKIRL